jgi:hypothetical protein
MPISSVFPIRDKWTLRATSLDDTPKPLLSLPISDRFPSLGLSVAGSTCTRVALEVALDKLRSEFSDIFADTSFDGWVDGSLRCHVARKLYLLPHKPQTARLKWAADGLGSSHAHTIGCIMAVHILH